MLETLKISRQANYRKFDTLRVEWTQNGKIRLKRWRPTWGLADYRPNAHAIENLLPGGEVVVSGEQLYEVRNK